MMAERHSTLLCEQKATKFCCSPEIVDAFAIHDQCLLGLENSAYTERWKLLRNALASATMQ
jgi:Fe-S oxidoreductase